MSIVIGIDIGGSTTKIVGVENSRVISHLRVKASDPVTSAYGAFGRFLDENRLSIEDIKKVMFTGVGASFLNGELYGLPSERVDEFLAVGTGGRYLSGIENSIVVSLGTGTAFVSVKGSDIHHFGGTGVGGGTVTGLADKMLGVHSHEHLFEMAKNGDLSSVDLTIGDISRTAVSNMNASVTASNFGKLTDSAEGKDIALGILNMVFQTVGVMAIFAARAENVGDIVITGNLSTVNYASQVFKGIEEIYNIPIIIPPLADYATAIGAAICGEE